MASLVAWTVKRLPIMQDTQVRSLGREVLWRRKWQPTPGKSCLENPMDRGAPGYSPQGRKESDMTYQLNNKQGGESSHPEY